ncbi:hypothetical protein JCM9279_006290 [Rhodotorula babjevae]
MPTAYSALPLGPGAHPPSSSSSTHARRRSSASRALLLPAVVHAHRRSLALVALVALLFCSTALLSTSPSAEGGGGVAARLGDTARRPFAAAFEQSTRAREATAAALRDRWGGAGRTGAGAGAGEGAASGEGEGKAGAGEGRGAKEGALAAVVETDEVDDEAGLARAKAAQGTKKRPRPFGKPAGAAAPPLDDLIDDTDSGSRASAADLASGTSPTRLDADDALDADLLADQPGLAALEDAAVRAPMAAIVPAAHRTDADESATDGEGHAAAPVADAAPAKKPSSADADAAAASSSDDDDAAAVPGAGGVGAPRPQIGTGGRLGSGAAADLKPPTRVGAGEKAGALVKAEAGRRVGTGARPGAKGMGTREREHELEHGAVGRRSRLRRTGASGGAVVERR